MKWCAAARLNGADLGARFFGPFRWRVRVEKGRNVLEVTVANLLANQVGDDAIRDRIQRDWPPAGPYDARQRPFDRDNRASGLFGPVTLRVRSRRANAARDRGVLSGACGSARIRAMDTTVAAPLKTVAKRSEPNQP